jgi:hypothetical protein
MSSLLDEFIKISEAMTTRQLLELDPEKLDKKSPDYQDLLKRKAEALQKVRTQPSKDELPLKNRLNRQMIWEGVMGAGIVGAGFGLGYGTRGLITSGEKKKIWQKYPAATIAAGLGAGGLALYARMRHQRAQEAQRIRAHSILKSRA